MHWHTLDFDQLIWEMKRKKKYLSLTSSSDLVLLSSEFRESSFVDISMMDGVKLVLGLLELRLGSVPLWVHASLVIPSFFFSAYIRSSLLNDFN